MKYLLLFILVLCIIILYRKYKSEQFEIEFVPRNFIGDAKCIKDDISLPNSYFKCQMNKKYSPININVSIIKYQNFAPEISINTLTPSFTRLSTLTPSLTPPPIFSNDDFTLIGTTKDPLTNNISLNNYKTLMKITKYTDSNLLLFDPLPDNAPVASAPLYNNNFPHLSDSKYLYLPNSIVTYLKYLNDLQLLQPFIDANKINTLTDITSQFNLYLQGQLINIVKPPTDNFRLQREIVVIYDNETKKNIVTIQFNQIITWYNSNNMIQEDKSSININTTYDYYIINSPLDNKKSIINKVNMYGSYLKSRELISDYNLDDLIDKINNDNNILYVNYYDFSIQLVKRIDSKLVFINYFDLNTNDYYKNICPDPINNISFKGRCYSDCPAGYESMGLACVLSSKKNKLFNPDSNFCNQVCNASNNNLSNFDTVLQKACWCKSISCEKCGEYSIDNCSC